MYAIILYDKVHQIFDVAEKPTFPPDPEGTPIEVVAITSGVKEGWLYNRVSQSFSAPPYVPPVDLPPVVPEENPMEDLAKQLQEIKNLIKANKVISHGSISYPYKVGSYTFIVPYGITKIYITACGGGGSGSYGTNTSNSGGATSITPLISLSGGSYNGTSGGDGGGDGGDASGGRHALSGSIGRGGYSFSCKDIETNEYSNSHGGGGSLGDGGDGEGKSEISLETYRIQTSSTHGGGGGSAMLDSARPNHGGGGSACIVDKEFSVTEYSRLEIRTGRGGSHDSMYGGGNGFVRIKW